MIDLHQGVTGEELRDVEPGLGAVALAQLDVVDALIKGEWKRAARKQAGAWVLLGRVALAAVGAAAGRPRGEGKGG